MRTGIYALRDKLAETILGGLHLHNHDASAVRFFTDVASTPDTQVNRHANDFELVRLGYLIQDENAAPSIAEAYNVILDGATWLASQRPEPSEP